MTPEEMGAALGPGWEPKLNGTGAFVWHDFVRGHVSVCENAGGWTVEIDRLGLRDAERVPAVAHLLVAAEQVAGGAEVYVDDPPFDREFPFAKAVKDNEGNGMVAPVARRWVTPAAARRHAIDLLRAADEAEAQR